MTPLPKDPAGVELRELVPRVLSVLSVAEQTSRPPRTPSRKR